MRPVRGPPSRVSEHRGTEDRDDNPLAECHLAPVRAGAAKTDQPRLTCRRTLGGAHEPCSDCSDDLPVSAPWPMAQPEIPVPKGGFKASARRLKQTTESAARPWLMSSGTGGLASPSSRWSKTMSGGVNRRSAARLPVSQRLDVESLVWASSQIATSLRQ